MTAVSAAAIAEVFRAEHGRAVAVLVRVFGDIDVAEEAVQDAFTAAVRRWPADGLPPSPAGWIITTARHRAIDRLRREASRADRHAEAVLPHARDADDAVEEGPVEDDRPERLAAVLAVVYLVFNEGHNASDGAALARADLCAEAIRLGRLLVALMPEEPEALGLLALMLLVASRAAARTTAAGDLVLLADQDRARWDRALIAEGHDLVRHCLRLGPPGPYGLQAAINAVHADAPTAAETGWAQIVALYDGLLAIGPNPVVALNRAVAVAEVDGAAAGLDLVDALDLDGYHVFRAVRADLLVRLGRPAEAAAAHDAAIAATGNAAERRFLAARRAALTP